MLKKLWQFHCCHSFQTVDKPLDYIKTGSQGRSPRQGLGAVAPHSAPARMPGVYAQRLCTTQSQQSIHSPSPRERGLGIGIGNKHFFEKTYFFYNLKRASAFTDVRFSVYCLSILTSYCLSRYSICKRYAKICGDVFGRKTAQLPKMSFTITKKAMRYQDELHNLPIWVMSFC